MDLLFAFCADKQDRILKLRDLIRGKRLRCVSYDLKPYGEITNDRVVPESFIREFINDKLCTYENFSYYHCKNGNYVIRLIVRDLDVLVFYKIVIYNGIKGGDINE